MTRSPLGLATETVRCSALPGLGVHTASLQSENISAAPRVPGFGIRIPGGWLLSTEGTAIHPWDPLQPAASHLPLQFRQPVIDLRVELGWRVDAASYCSDSGRLHPQRNSGSAPRLATSRLPESAPASVKQAGDRLESGEPEPFLAWVTLSS